MNFYSASVALLWGTAFRSVAPLTASRQSVTRKLFRKAALSVRPVKQAVDRVSRATRPG